MKGDGRIGLRWTSSSVPPEWCHKSVVFTPVRRVFAWEQGECVQVVSFCHRDSWDGLAFAKEASLNFLFFCSPCDRGETEFVLSRGTWVGDVV